MTLQAPSTHEAGAYMSSETIDKLKGVAIILLFGPSGSGKTSFANVASGSSMRVGHGVKSSTQQVEFSDTFYVDNEPVVVVDCPGFDDTYLSETQILQCLVGFLTAAYSNKLKITGLIYMHRIIDPRVGGSSFRHMNMFKAMCGPESLRNAVYVTNMWSEPPTENELRREAELMGSEEFFRGPLAGGARMVRHVGTRESAREIVRLMLGKDSAVTRLQRQLVDEEMKLEDTDVGRLLGEDLESALDQHQQDMEELNAQQERAIELNNQEWITRLEAQTKKTEERGRQLVEQLKLLRGSKRPERTTHRAGERVPNPHATPSGVTDVMAGFLKIMDDMKQRDNQRREEGLVAEKRRQEALSSQANAFVAEAYHDIHKQSQPALNFPPARGRPRGPLPSSPSLPSLPTSTLPPPLPSESRQQTIPAPKATGGHPSRPANYYTTPGDLYSHNAGSGRIQDEGTRGASSSRGDRRARAAEGYYTQPSTTTQGESSHGRERVSWDRGSREEQGVVGRRESSFELLNDISNDISKGFRFVANMLGRALNP